jgi:hypothetical protein
VWTDNGINVEWRILHTEELQLIFFAITKYSYGDQIEETDVGDTHSVHQKKKNYINFIPKLKEYIIYLTSPPLVSAGYILDREAWTPNTHSHQFQ